MIELGSKWRLKQAVSDNLDSFKEIIVYPKEFYVLQVKGELVDAWHAGCSAMYIINIEKLEVYWEQVGKCEIGTSLVKTITVENRVFVTSKHYGLVELV